MKDALTHIVHSIVENTDAVVIDEVTEDTTTTFTITVAPEEVGKIIGKSGKVIRSIRNVLKIPAMKAGIRVIVNINA